TAFLNPPEFFNGHAFGTLTPKQAAGSVVMGSVDQPGNEIDEFVTETLRKDIFRDTGDAQMAPYTSWADYGQHLKHPESLINYVAAYGTHPSILAANTIAGKRAAAKLIVDPADPLDPAI